MKRKSWRAHALLPFVAIFSLSSSFQVWAGDPGKGAQVYTDHCVVCHGERGEGAVPGVPDFTRGAALLAPDRNLANTIRLGKTSMPAFQGLLKDPDIYDVIAFLRTLH